MFEALKCMIYVKDTALNSQLLIQLTVIFLLENNQLALNEVVVHLFVHKI